MTGNALADSKPLPKADRYELLLRQADAILTGESDCIAALSNLAALLKQVFDFHWCGFYRVHSENGKSELVLGPFQGPVACSRIAFGRGVCGKAWQEKRMLNVGDVNAFPGHIACSPLSKSEIVIPVFKNEEVVMVLDIDSENENHFDPTDEKYLRLLCQRLGKAFWQ